MIATLEETTSETEEEERQRVAELNALRKKKAEIIENPAIIGPTYSNISPRGDGRPSSPITKFTRCVSPETSMREQNVIALLQKQRKFSAPSSHYSSQLNFSNPPNSNSPTNQDNNGYQITASRHFSSPNLIRTSSPAILEGMSTPQMQNLYSYHSQPKSLSPRSPNGMRRDNFVTNSLDSVKRPIEKGENEPQDYSPRSNQSLFNFRAPHSEYAQNQSRATLPETSERISFTSNPCCPGYPPSTFPNTFLGTNQVYTYPEMEKSQYNNFPSRTVTKSSFKEENNNCSSQFEFVPSEYPSHPNARFTFTSYPNA